MDFREKRVLITGGASGIGKLMGEAVLRKGARLIIWDISDHNISASLSDLKPLGEVTAMRVDVADTDAVLKAAEEVRKHGGAPDVLINNAGIVAGNRLFHEHTHEDIERTMRINALAPMHVTLAFLPEMVARNSGHICTIASSAGLVSNPRMSVYVASKWSATGWSDSLRIEMQQKQLNLGVTTVTPYYIDTGMFAGVRSPVVPILNPKKVVRRIIRGIERNRMIISMPWTMHFVRFSQGIMPIRLFDWFVGRVLGVYRTMDHFTGRKEQ